MYFKRPKAITPSTRADSFSKIAAGVQSIVVVIAACVGGWWAITTFVFQNPGYTYQGWELAGSDPTAIKEELSLECLDSQKRQYEITLKLTNMSKTHHESVLAEKVEILYFQPGETQAKRAKFSSLSSTHTAIDVPMSESRELRFFAEFPHDGIYVVEDNLGKFLGENCLAQKYVSVVSANRVGQQTPTTEPK